MASWIFFPQKIPHKEGFKKRPNERLFFASTHATFAAHAFVEKRRNSGHTDNDVNHLLSHASGSEEGRNKVEFEGSNKPPVKSSNENEEPNDPVHDFHDAWIKNKRMEQFYPFFQEKETFLTCKMPKLGLPQREAIYSEVS